MQVRVAVVNALALRVSKLTDHVSKECKRLDLALERIQRARDEWNRDRVKRLDFINKVLREKKMSQRHTLTALTRQW